jgi:hypothetical protein
MGSKFDFADWFNNEQKRGKPVAVKMENPNYDMLEVDSPTIGKRKDAKQMSWVFLLKANKAAGFVAWGWSGVMVLLSAVKERLILQRGIVKSEGGSKGRRFYILTCLVVLAVMMLCIEVGAHAKGWQLSVPHWPSSFSLQSVPHTLYLGWMYIRAEYMAPALQKVTDFCIGLFLLQSLDRIILCCGCVYIKWKKIKPVPVNPSLESDDVEEPDKGYPMCLVQIPMCNEREVCCFSRTLGAAVLGCGSGCGGFLVIELAVCTLGLAFVCIFYCTRGGFWKWLRK